MRWGSTIENLGKGLKYSSWPLCANQRFVLYLSPDRAVWRDAEALDLTYKRRFD